MLMVIDVGNTRTKWAEVNSDGRLSDTQMSPNATIAQSTLKNQLPKAERVMIANVAGDDIAKQLMAVMPDHVIATFVRARAEACNVINRYQESEALGVDRWAAVIAAWHRFKQPVIVVSAGTAITIDSVTADSVFKLTALKRTASAKGLYIGGTIMPGMYAMHDALVSSTANLPSVAGEVEKFPTCTVDAMQTGCTNAVVGSILLQLKQLEKHCAFLPKVVITGGDAVKIGNQLKKHLKRVVIAENLVLQGLVLLGKEYL